MATLGRYELRDMLGEGGFATVYRAWDPALGREVALKALRPHLAADDEFRRRFLAEARTIARLAHPNIITVYDVGEADGYPFFAMQLIDGQTLAQLMAGRPLDPARVVSIVRDLCAAVDALHHAGLVHRDIKAANVMLERTGRVVLMDFGIARTLDRTAYTRTGALMGTPEAMAPEQIRGEAVGPAADIYALGVLTYQLLAGRPPFEGDTARLLYAHAHEPPPPLEQARPGLPAHVYAAVNAALAKEPAQRPPSADHFAAALAGASVPPEPVPPPRRSPDPVRTSAPTASAPEPAARPRPRYPAAVIGGGAALAVLLLLGAVAALVIRARSADQRGGAAAASAAQSPTASGDPPRAGLPAIAGLRVYDNISDKREGEFVVGRSVVVCFTLTPAADGTPLIVLVTDRPDQPRDATDPSVVAHSEPFAQQAGANCQPADVTTASLAAPAPYYVWVLDSTAVIARAGFRAIAAPVARPSANASAGTPSTASTPAPTPTPAPASVPTRPSVPVTPVPPASAQGDVVVIKQYGAAVRTAPSSDAASLGAVGCGTRLRVFEASGGWYRVAYPGPGGGQGWVGSLRVADAADPPPFDCTGATTYNVGDVVVSHVDTGCLSLRTTPSRTAPYQHCVDNGHRYVIRNGPIEVDGEDWFEVSSDSTGDGWSLAQYLLPSR